MNPHDPSAGPDAVAAAAPHEGVEGADAERPADALADWGDFLRIRHELIHRWIGEGKNAGQIIDALAMDVMQVTLIAMTPLGARESDPRWTAR